jgi:ankyrin repeat protein
MTDNEGYNSFCLASEVDCFEICEYLINMYLETLSLLKQSSSDSYPNDENIYAYPNGLKTLYNHRNNDGDTPIFLACANARLDCVKLWIKKYISITDCGLLTSKCRAGDE